MQYLLQGAALGFAAGISPGPMLALVISQTLRRGWRAGNLVALAPLVTDAPIIVLAVLVLGHVPAAALDALALLGGLFVVCLGVDALRHVSIGLSDHAPGHSGRVMLTAVATNAANPHPYLFWVVVGGPLLVRASAAGGPAPAAAFLAAFYALLVGAKLAVAAAVGWGRMRGGEARVTGPIYRLLLTVSGALLLVVGVWLVWQGVRGVLMNH